MTGPEQPEALAPTSAPWVRPKKLGYSETLRGLGGIVAPLLTGFSLATIALLLTSRDKPQLANWAVAALATTVAFLLFSMQVAFLALARSPSPADILTWEPQVAISLEDLQKARAEQAARSADMSRLWRLCGSAYDIGIVSLLAALLLLLIPYSWTAPRIAAVVIVGLALTGELWWTVANLFESRMRHPVVLDSNPATFADKLAPLNQVGVAAVQQSARSEAKNS